eukprot:gnl/TRDRNA2_/TRDRNA2_179520_c0_seq1.p2 gnl/TRDRNA2_/TRDRNA2_179520_c0~~gnl/TRDRNA2_/TRDRNA2_179520_c0_seq1.p2  ORF type:complete len:106 (-),score=14.73 gnl/TRDRNA2_/TRDRNA2_179520_c0_seq1:101-418(-)
MATASLTLLGSTAAVRGSIDNFSQAKKDADSDEVRQHIDVVDLLRMFKAERPEHTVEQHIDSVELLRMFEAEGQGHTAVGQTRTQVSQLRNFFRTACATVRLARN